LEKNDSVLINRIKQFGSLRFGVWGPGWGLGGKAPENVDVLVVWKVTKRLIKTLTSKPKKA